MTTHPDEKLVTAPARLGYTNPQTITDHLRRHEVVGA